MEVIYGHRVAAAATSEKIGPEDYNTVPVAVLRQFLEKRRGSRALSAKELTEYRTSDNSAFLLSFDDGYQDNLSMLLPVLEEYSAPVLIFITTEFVGGKQLPLETLLTTLVLEGPTVKDEQGKTYSCQSIDEKQETYALLRRRSLKAGLTAQSALLKEWFDLNQTAWPLAEGVFLSWEEIKKLDEHPLVTIGAHSVQHRRLDYLPSNEAWVEINGAKQELENKLNHPIDYFAYPYGAHSWKSRRLVRRAGYQLAFATGNKSFNRLSSWQRFRIPRIDIVKFMDRPND